LMLTNVRGTATADYYVSPPEETDLAIEPYSFANNLRRHWPSADVQMIDNPQSIRALEWTLPLDKGVLRGSLHQTGQVVVLDGDVEDAAEFALWVRTLVPIEYTLLFYDEGYSTAVELRLGMTVEEIANSFLT